MEPRDENTRKNVLIVKNLPKQINDLPGLLKTPAEQIKSFGRRRVLLHYSSKTEADAALNDLEERGLTVAKFTTHKEENGQNVWKKKVNKTTQTKKPPKKVCNDEEDLAKNVNALIGANIDFDKPPPPYLKYAYPSINGNILNAINKSLLKNKRFYTQVLHLMNRMNLEPPFSAKGADKTLLILSKDASTQTLETEPQLRETKKSVFEEEETELEISEDENEKVIRPLKRKSDFSNVDAYKKRARQLLEQTHKISTAKPDVCVSNTDKMKSKLNFTEIFEDAKKKKPSKIALKLLPNSESNPTQIMSCFEPPADLSTNQMAITELEKLPIYKNYIIGDPTNKLYIKNLAKQVTSVDLLALYKRFLSPDQLEIKVMQQGRMKGQAFVTFNGLSKFDTHEIVLKALHATHGFILYEKPMIVCYGKQS